MSRAWRYSGLGLFFLVTYGPIAGLVPSFVGVTGPGPAVTWLVPLVWKSAGLAAAVAAATVVLGFAAALALRQHLGPRRDLAWALWLMLALAPIPPFLHALAWSDAARWLPALAGRPAASGSILQGWTAAWWIQTIAWLPLTTGLAAVGLRTIDGTMTDAARLHVAPASVLARVIVPLAAPALAAAGGLVFVFSLVDYSVPSLCGINTLALDVLTEFSVANDAAAAARVALPLMVTAAATVLALQAGLRRAVEPAVIPAGRLLGGPMPVGLSAPLAFALGLVAAQAAVVTVSLMVAAGSPGAVVAGLHDAWPEVTFSLGVAACTAGLVLAAALPAAARLSRGGAGSGVWWGIVLLPLAMPPALVGVGLIGLWNAGALSLYGSPAMPVLAASARVAPVAALILLAHARRIDPALIEAGRVLRVNRYRRWACVDVPLWAPGLAAAGGVAFVLAMGELGATLLVAPPGRATLAMRLYNYLHYGASDRVAGVCLALVAGVVGVGTVAAVVTSRASARCAAEDGS